MSVTLTFACDRCGCAASCDLTAGEYLEPMSALGQLDNARLTGFHVLLCADCAKHESVGNDTRDVDLPDGVTFRAVAL